MKIGLIIKPEFHLKYGKKVEIHGIEITISRVQESKIYIEAIQIGTRQTESFPVKAIQLIYLGEWNIDEI